MNIKKDLLTEEEHAILADFVNSEYWPVYRKVQMNTQRNLEKVSITAENMEKLNFYRGQAYQIQKEMADFTRNFKKISEAKRKLQIESKKNAEKDKV